ncbi:MAG: hypothetical protein Q9227_005264 [Pyrenula ochraceoflavens]
MSGSSRFDKNVAFSFNTPFLAQESSNLEEEPPVPPKRKRGRPRKDEPKRVPFRTSAALAAQSKPKFEFVNMSNAEEAPSAETRRTIRKQAMLHHLRKRQAKAQSAKQLDGGGEQGTDDPRFRTSKYFEELRGHHQHQVIYYFRPIRRMNPMFLASILIDPARVYHIFSNLDAVKDRQASPTAVVLKQQLIQKINNNLIDPVQAVSIENLAAVMSIRIGSNVYEWGTRKEAEAHTQGLNKMIMHRGGLSTLDGNVAAVFLQKMIIMSDHIVAATNVRPPAFPTAALVDRASTAPPVDLVAECPFYCPPDRDLFSNAARSKLCTPETYSLLHTLHAYIHDFSSPTLRTAHRARLIDLTITKLPTSHPHLCPPLSSSSPSSSTTTTPTTSSSPKPLTIRDSIYTCLRLSTLILLHISSLHLPLRHALTTIPPSYAAELKRTLKSTSLWFFWDDLFFLHWWCCIVGACATMGRPEYPYFIASAAHATYQIMVDEHLFFGGVMSLRRFVWWQGLCERLGPPEEEEEEVGGEEEEGQGEGEEVGGGGQGGGGGRGRRGGGGKGRYYGALDRVVAETGLATEGWGEGVELKRMHPRENFAGLREKDRKKGSWEGGAAGLGGSGGGGGHAAGGDGGGFSN